MSNVFFIGDTHFYHRNILRFTDKFDAPLRDFDDVEEMNEHIVDRWNSVVGKRDFVFHLGDVAMNHGGDLSILDRLNGRKHLILGNHDDRDSQVYLKHFERLHGMKKYKYGVLLTHAPVHPSSLVYRFAINVHGHVHKDSLDDPRYLNVSAEVIDYTPMSFDEVKAHVDWLGNGE